MMEGAISDFLHCIQTASIFNIVTWTYIQLVYVKYNLRAFGEKLIPPSYLVTAKKKPTRLRDGRTLLEACFNLTSLKTMRHVACLISHGATIPPFHQINAKIKPQTPHHPGDRKSDALVESPTSFGLYAVMAASHFYHSNLQLLHHSNPS